MSIALQLDQMTIVDKIRTMEYLWDDLFQRSEISSPQWHKDILLKREQDVMNGDNKFSDWNAVKNKIRDFLR